ncbi:MAG: 4Fe-4S binding protein [Planctomycetes bacterium]|nr:4Fe-4S binding protein [Planctomycetota bacterium]
MRRPLLQITSAVLMNPYIPGFVTGAIYSGAGKAACAPGLNCYSCPGALMACPIGSIQAVLSVPGALQSTAAGKFEVLILFYVLGFVSLIGVFVGRMMCGWACPFGFVQDLLHKIPVKKYAIPAGWANMKFAMLLIFVIALPLFLKPGLLTPTEQAGDPWFCKIICPAGTLEAGIPLVGYDRAFHAESLYQTGALFLFKLGLLGAFIAWMAFVSRPFCRTVCPLGAIWSLFNKISFYQMRVDKGKCIECEKCYKICPTQVRIYQKPADGNCVRCLECVKVCPVQCINENPNSKIRI